MILLLGSHGYIGSEFARQMTQRELLFTTVKHGDEPSIRPSMTDLVINCAAFIPPRSVDDCEDHKRETVLGNLLLPHQLAIECEDNDVPLMQISTGCLYNGTGIGFSGFKETDPPELTFDTGAGIYVSSKELAERLVLQYDKAYSLRIRLPFDDEDHPRNLISKLMLFDRVYDDTNSMTCRKDFVCAALDLWERRAPFGCYNMTNDGSIMASDICLMISDILKTKRHSDWRYWTKAEFHAKARTKKSNCTLDISKLLATGVRMRHVRDAVEWSLKNWRPAGHVSEPHQMSSLPESGPASAA